MLARVFITTEGNTHNTKSSSERRVLAHIAMPQDEPPPYVVRFKVLKIESPALVNGAMYGISWRRGSCRGSAPPFVCDGGVVDMSTMPEGQAVLHFKPNDKGSKGQARYQSKYINLYIEENSRGRQNQVGMLEFDVANCLRGRETSCQVIKEVGFRMSGFGASISVLVTLFPEGSTPPSRGAEMRLVEGGGSTAAAVQAPPSAQDAQQQRKPLPQSHVATTANPTTAAAPPSAALAGGAASRKTVSRQDAMTLLLSVEGLLEQTGMSAQHQYAGEDAATLAKEIQELEERVDSAKKRLNAKRMLQIAAQKVATAETSLYPAAQFRTLQETEGGQRFVRDVTAYLEPLYQQHVTGRSASVTGAGSSAASPLTLTELNVRIATVQQELQHLQQEQETLARLQLRRDVSDEAIKSLGRIHAKEQLLAKLQQQRSELPAQGAAQRTDGPSGWEIEKSELLEEIIAINTKRETFARVATGAVNIYATRIEDWASRRFAPMREYDRLHKEIQQREVEEQKHNKQIALKKQILDLFGDLEAPPQTVVEQPHPTAAPPQTEASAAQPGTTSPETKQAPPKDMFEDLYRSVPKASDFGPSASNRQDEQPKGLQAEVKKVPEPVYQFGNEEKQAESANGNGTGSTGTGTTTTKRRDPFSDLRGELLFSDHPVVASSSSVKEQRDSPKLTFNFANDKPSEFRPAFQFGDDGDEGGNEGRRASSSSRSTMGQAITFVDNSSLADEPKRPAPSLGYDFGSDGATTSAAPASEAIQQDADDSFWTPPAAFAPPPHTSSTFNHNRPQVSISLDADGHETTQQGNLDAQLGAMSFGNPNIFATFEDD